MKSRVEALLSSGLSEANRAELVIRYNASLNTAKAFNADPTASRQRDWDAAKKGLAEFITMLETMVSGHAAHTGFLTAAAVHAYLVEAGYKVGSTPRTVRHHIKEGKLAFDPSGIFTPEAVDRYAKIHLRQSATGRKANDRNTLLQENKLKEEIGKLKAQRIRSEFEMDILRGKYISRIDHDTDLIAQAHGIVNYLSRLKHTLPALLVETARGDAACVQAVYILLSEAIDAILAEYATVKTHTVTLPDDLFVDDAHDAQVEAA